MERLLIVEDEKMIRKGIRAIAERSGVCIGEIFEARNGVEAYEYLCSNKVDLMFTDIRMPKMDGIQLVKKLNEEQKLPKVIVISGYDDFEYATELMRCGARDYMLKPIEMDKLTAVLYKMEEEIVQEKEQWRGQEELRSLQLKNIFLQNIETSVLEKQFMNFFKGKPVQLICTPHQLEQIREVDSWEVIEEEGGIVYVMLQEDVETCIPEELKKTVGISEPFCKPSSIHKCYNEAKQRRVQTFLQLKKESGKENKTVPEERQILNLVQLIGSPKVDCCVDFLKKVLWDTQSGEFYPSEYFQIMEDVEKQVFEQYSDLLSEEEKNGKKKILSYVHATEYQRELEEFILKISKEIAENSEEYKNKMKMREAVRYIQENYEKELNMAEVSNYIGISYSWFSTVFKQYTGLNFVNYLKNIRLEEAKKLLSNTDLKIQDISKQVGYENELHFMKIFKSSCGISPTQYRTVSNVKKIKT